MCSIHTPGAKTKTDRQMKAKINYLSKWNAEGDHYNQTVTVTLTAGQIDAINALIGKLSFARIFSDSFFIGEGLNFVTLSAARIIARYIGIDSDRRYKSDRNTAFNIIAA